MMIDESIREEILSKRPLQLPMWFLGLLLLFILAGVAVFIARIMGSNPGEAWQIYLVNFIFWTGIAQGGVVFACALRITSAKWGRPIMRVAEALGSFLPVSFLLLLILFLGKDYILPYATQDYGAKEAWLNIPFVAAREVGGVLILFSLSLLYLYYSLREDLGGTKYALSGLAAWVALGWKGEDERAHCYTKLSTLSPIITLLYAIVFSFLAFDFMMSLDPHWVSTLFGVYYVEASFLGAIGMIVVLSIMVRKHLTLQDYITNIQFRDLGRLMFGFSLGWAYLFFSQFLTIWYGNMPEEAHFLIARLKEQPFQSVAWVVISCVFFFPLIALLPRTNKVVTPIFAFIAAVSLAGLWLEKFVIIIPTFTPQFHISLAQLVITLGFLSAFILMFSLFVKAFPIMPLGDPYFAGKIKSQGSSGGH